MASETQRKLVNRLGINLMVRGWNGMRNEELPDELRDGRIPAPDVYMVKNGSERKSIMLADALDAKKIASDSETARERLRQYIYYVHDLLLKDCALESVHVGIITQCEFESYRWQVWFTDYSAEMNDDVKEVVKGVGRNDLKLKGDRMGYFMVYLSLKRMEKS